MLQDLVLGLTAFQRYEMQSHKLDVIWLVDNRVFKVAPLLQAPRMHLLSGCIVWPPDNRGPSSNKTQDTLTPGFLSHGYQEHSNKHKLRVDTQDM